MQLWKYWKSLPVTNQSPGPSHLPFSPFNISCPVLLTRFKVSWYSWPSPSHCLLYTGRMKPPVALHLSCSPWWSHSLLKPWLLLLQTGHISPDVLGQDPTLHLMGLNWRTATLWWGWTAGQPWHSDWKWFIVFGASRVYLIWYDLIFLQWKLLCKLYNLFLNALVLQDFINNGWQL